MNQILTISIVVFLLIISGCDIPGTNAVIDTQIPPTIIEASISPSSVDFGKINSTGSINDVSVTGYVNTTDDNGLEDIAAVNYSIYSPNGNLFTSGSLADNGVFPDAQQGDGKYNSTIALHLPKEIIGIYNVQFSTTDRQGFTSNTFNLPLRIVLSTNGPPVISNLQAPDSVRVPKSADSVNLVFISLDVSDPDGLNDVTSVVLTSQRPDSTVSGTFFLSDDGGAVILPQFGIASGDGTANDGKYSITIPIFSTATTNTYRDFIFSARDQSGIFSNIITKRVFIY